VASAQHGKRRRGRPQDGDTRRLESLLRRR
jgi:hypothetical protein